MKKLFTLFILLLLLPWAARAQTEQVSYIYYTENGDGTITRHEDGNATATEVPTTTDWGGSDDQEHWYVASGTVTISSRVTVTGDVHLILTDECNLTVNGGINVSKGNSLTIYAQSTDETTMGKLVAAVEGSCAGIGGDENQNGGIITIHGGAVTATVTKAEGDRISAGIGGYGGTIIIYGGMVTATSSGGTGIGDNNCTITIYGGTVNATGFGGAGIGGYGGTVTISGGTVTATGNYSAGIGGGSYGAGGSITISGGTVNATSNGGAGIGGGIGGDGGTITISGGTVNATSNGGAGIGGGNGGDSGTFSTGTDGNAFIIASSDTGDAISDNDDKTNWSGVIFEGKNGGVYGNQTLKQDLTINNDETLTIVKDAKLTIPDDVTLTNEGTIVNYGTIDGTVKGTAVLIGLTEEMIEVEEATYTGKPVTPEVTVKGDYKEGEDYTVSYSDNINAGTATVTVTPKGSKLGGAAVEKEFTIAKATATLSFAEETVSATIGETVENTLIVDPEGVAVSYSSSDEEVATVNASTGAVTLVGAGTTTITATATGNYTGEASYTLTVTKELEEDEIAAEGETNISIEMGGAAFELTAQVTADDLGTGGTWTWASNNEAVATVDLKEENDASGYSLRATTTSTVTSTAIVTPHSVGTATITATYTDSKYTGTVDFTVTITEPEPEEPKPPIYQPSYYNIYVEDVCEGVDITTSKNVVREGGTISLYVEKDTANYTFDNFKVYYKRSYYGPWEVLEEGVQPGEYPIRNIWTHIYIKAEGAEEKEDDPTGMEHVEGVKVYTKDGSLYVQTPQREQVLIISMSGAVVKNEEQIGLKQYHGLQPGIYIVRVGDRTYKLRL